MSSATLFVWAWQGLQERPHPSLGHGPGGPPGCGSPAWSVGAWPWGLCWPAPLLPSCFLSQSIFLLARPGLHLRACVRASVCVCVAVPCPATRHQRQLSCLWALGLSGRGAHEWWDDPLGPGSGNVLQLDRPPQTPAQLAPEMAEVHCLPCRAGGQEAPRELAFSSFPFSSLPFFFFLPTFHFQNGSGRAREMTEINQDKGKEGTQWKGRDVCGQQAEPPPERRDFQGAKGSIHTRVPRHRLQANLGSGWFSHCVCQNMHVRLPHLLSLKYVRKGGRDWTGLDNYKGIV